MRLRHSVACAAVAIALMLAPATGRSQDAKRARSPDLLSTLKAGQWVRLAGSLQKDHSVLCTEVRQLTGDFLDDDWGLKGQVKHVDGRRREFTVGPFKVHAAKNAEFDSEEGDLMSFADLRSGMIVEVEGTYLKDGTFFAREVDNETAEEARKPGIVNHIEIVARVEHVDPEKRRITAMGTRFQINGKTQLKSVIQ